MPTVDDVRGAGVALARIGEGSDDAERIDLIRALEELKCSAEAAQAVLTAAFDRSQREAEARAGVPEERQGRAVAAQVALARRESPHRGRQHVGLAVVLDELPCTRAAFRAGRITEWRAMLLARETACLSRADRAEVDRRVAGDPDVLEGMGDGELVGQGPRAGLRARPGLVRRTTTPRRGRPPGLPASGSRRDEPALRRCCRSRTASPSGRCSAARPTGPGPRATSGRAARSWPTRWCAASSAPGRTHRPVPLMINVVVPDSVLLGDDDGFGWVEHYGPVPGDLLREWIAANAEQGVDQWVRRLYATPTTGELVSMDSKARRFEGALADYLRLRDQTCRTRVLRRPGPPPRPRRGPRRRRSDQRGQRAGAVRALQLRQAGPRLDRPTATRTPPHHRDRDPHGSPIPEHRTADDGCRARTAGRAGWVTCSRPDRPARAPGAGCRSALGSRSKSSGVPGSSGSACVEIESARRPRRPWWSGATVNSSIRLLSQFALLARSCARSSLRYQPSTVEREVVEGAVVLLHLVEELGDRSRRSQDRVPE